MVRSFLLLGALVTLGGCALLQHTDPPKVTLAGVEPSSSASEGFEARMQLKLHVENPNATPIDYNGIYVELDLMGKSFASGESNQSGTVPAFGDTMISVPVSVSIFGIAKEAMGLLGGQNLSKIDYAMSGKLGTVRFRSQGELNVSDLMSGGK